MLLKYSKTYGNFLNIVLSAYIIADFVKNSSRQSVVVQGSWS